ncbi:hypothetical protein GCM10027347_60400 [Larkinella harenae]
MKTMNLADLHVEELTHAEMTQHVGGGYGNNFSYESNHSKTSFGTGLSLDFGLSYEKESHSQSFESHRGSRGGLLGLGIL